MIKSLSERLKQKTKGRNFFTVMDDVKDIPDGTTDLIFSPSFDKSLKHGDIPDGIVTLQFKKYDRPLKRLVIPSSVKNLRLGDEFNQKLEPGMIPNSVAHLYIGPDYQHEIGPGIIPDSVEYLIFGIREHYEWFLGTITTVYHVDYHKKDLLYLPKSLRVLRLCSEYEGTVDLSQCPDITEFKVPPRCKVIYPSEVEFFSRHLEVEI